MERKCSHFYCKSHQANILLAVIAYFLSHLERNTSSRHSDSEAERERKRGRVRGAMRTRETKQKRRGERISAPNTLKKKNNSPSFGRRALGITVWSKCSGRAERERISDKKVRPKANRPLAGTNGIN